MQRETKKNRITIKLYSKIKFKMWIIEDKYALKNEAFLDKFWDEKLCLFPFIFKTQIRWTSLFWLLDKLHNYLAKIKSNNYRVTHDKCTCVLGLKACLERKRENRENEL